MIYEISVSLRPYIPTSLITLSLSAVWLGPFGGCASSREKEIEESGMEEKGIEVMRFTHLALRLAVPAF